ncbi:MAG: hypothetical protein RIB60_03780 [Phycisphaerales bacterium]
MSVLTKDTPAGDLGPLSPEHFVQLRQSNRRARKLRGASRFASVSGWTTMFAGILTLPFAIGNGTLLALALALCAIGYHELALRRSLRKLEASAPGMLALNQLLLAGVLIGYAVWKLLNAEGGAGMISTAFADPAIANEPALANLTTQMESLQQTVVYGIYGGLILAVALVQGLAIRYYLSRRRHLRQFVSETPAWVITLHRAGVMG